jgi:anti-anti-sigma factor
VDEALYFREFGDELFIRAMGHLTAALCPELKSRTFPRIDADPQLAAVYFDLSACEYMDSTFLGFIVGLNKRLKARSGKAVVLLHVNPTCLSLLKTIGVLKLVELSDEDKAFPEPMEKVGPGPRATAEFLLNAHEELTDLSEENKARFSTLTNALKDSIKKGDA